MSLSRAAVVFGFTLMMSGTAQAVAAAPVGPPTPATAPADLAEMERLEAEAFKAVEAANWAAADAAFRALLEIELRAFPALDPRTGATYSWLIRSGREVGRPVEAIEALARERLRYAEAVPGDLYTLGYARHTLALVLTEAGRPEAALPYFDSALTALVASRPTNDPLTAAVCDQYADALLALGRKQDALRPLGVRYDALKADPAAEPAVLAAAAARYGQALHDLGRYAESEPVLRAALESRRKAGAPDSVLGQDLSYLGAALRDLNRPSEAEPLHREAFALFRKAYGDEHVVVAGQARILGFTLLDQHKYAEALAAFSLAVAIAELAGDVETLWFENVIEAASALYMWEAVETVSRRLIDLHREGDPEALARAHGFLGDALVGLGKPAEAEAEYRRALALTRIETQRPIRLMNLATVLTNLGRGHEAEPIAQQALAATERAAGSSSPEIAGSLEHLARLLGAKGEWPRVEQLLRKALAIRQGLPSPSPADIVRLKIHIGIALNGQQRYSEASQFLTESLVQSVALYKGKHPLRVAPLRPLAFAFMELGQPDLAEAILKQTVGDFEPLYGPEHPETLAVLHELAAAVYAQKRYDEAETLMRRVVGANSSGAGKARAQGHLGVALIDSGKPREALPLLREAGAAVGARVQKAAGTSWSRADRISSAFIFRNAVRAAWEASAKR
ncbi:MAG TPA: tetratricopeptide repeat protein [Caulobacteraceae bacterium]|nr:tetratricopeptide repeat protein [Caulobacteraceae bacterium]